MLRTKFELRFETFPFAHTDCKIEPPVYSHDDALSIKALAKGFAECANRGLFDFDDAPEHAKDFKLDPAEMVAYVAKGLNLHIHGVDKNLDPVTGTVVVTLYFAVPVATKNCSNDVPRS